MPISLGVGGRTREILPPASRVRWLTSFALSILVVLAALPLRAWAQAPVPVPAANPTPTAALPPSSDPVASASIQEAPTAVTVVLDGAEFLIFVLSGPAGPLFALEPIAEKLGIVVASDPFGEGRIFEAGGVRVALHAGSALVTLDQELITLSQPVTKQNDRVFVPLDLIERALGDTLGLGAEFRSAERQLVLRRDALRSLEVLVDIVHLRGTTTLAVRTADGAVARYRLQRAADGALEVVFPGQRLTSRLAGTANDPYVRRVSPRSDRLRLDLAPATEVEHYELRDPFRIVLDFSFSATSTPPGPGSSAAGSGSAILRLRQRSAEGKGPGLHTIVLDPGHGGGESGALGSRGLAEKNLTLDLARRLRGRLTDSLPVRVVLTRDEDSTLGLSERSALANEHRADLFVSLHLNSSFGGTPHGAETYFLSLEASDERAASSALTENLAAAEGAPGAGGEGETRDDDLELLLWDLAQTRHLARSQRVATLIQEELNASLGLRDRGVKQAPFRVLMGANMPAVLVELGFLSNPEEETKLGNAAYQEQLVDSLVRAIVRFQAELAPEAPESGLPLAGPPP